MIKTDQQFRKWMINFRDFLENKCMCNEDVLVWIREHDTWPFFKEIDEFMRTHTDEEIMEILNK